MEQTMAAPELPEYLMEAILLLLPPDDPSCLLRASLIGKPWSHVATLPDFLRRLHARHGVPPLLGFLHNSGDPRFVPTTASPFSLRAPDRDSWRALDFRHGRALFISVAVHEEKGVRELLVWAPTTGHQRRVPAPEALRSDFSNGAVLCAADGCDHLDCRGGPFRVAFVSFDEAPAGSVTSACVYSSEAGTWGEPATLGGTSLDFNQPGLLVGDSGLYFMSDSRFIIEYDLASNGLGLFDTPDMVLGLLDRFVLVLAQNGGLGAAVAMDSRLHLWAREPDAPWLQTRVIELANLIPVGPLETPATSPKVMGYASGTNTVFVSTIAGLFTIDLQSEQARQVSEDRHFYPLIPIVSFCIPSWTPKGEDHDLNAGEGGGQEVKTLEQAQALFEKGSKAMEERDLIHAVDCLSHALKIRVALYGQLAPECASTYYKYGCALLLKVRELAIPSGNVLKKTWSEESLRSTASKAHTKNSHTKNSKIPGSNHENTPSFNEGYFGNGQNSNGTDQEDETGDASMAGDDADSELNLAWEMLDLARRIVEQKPDDNTMEKAKLLFAMAEVSLERGDLDNSLGYYSEALAILEHLVEPDHHRILEINFRICLVFESASKVGDAIQYCVKAIALCKSRLVELKNDMEASLADEGGNAFATEGSSENSTLEDEMVFFAGVVAELEKKIEELEAATSTTSSAVNGTLNRVPPRSPVSGILPTLCQELYMDL